MAKKRKKTDGPQRHLENLFVPLTDEEVAAYADQAAHEIHQIDLRKAELSVRNKIEKESIEGLELQARDKLRKVRERKEERDVQCETEMDFAQNTVRVIRLDTLAVVRERAMTPDERQDELPYIGAQAEEHESA